MSRNSQISFGSAGRAGASVGASLFARIPAVCRDALDAFGRAGGSKCAAPPFPRKLLFETMEPRVLLSADLATAASAIISATQSASQPAAQAALSSHLVSLSDDPDASGFAVVHLTGHLEAEALAKADSPVDQWRLDLEQGDVVALSVDTPDSDLDPYLWLGDANARQIAAGDNSGPGGDALISHQKIPATGAYYVQISPSQDGATSGRYDLLVEPTRGVEQNSDAANAADALTNAGNILGFDALPAPDTALAAKSALLDVTQLASDHPVATIASRAVSASTAVLATWIGGSGNWSDPTHWDIGIAPNNTASEIYDVVLDGAGTPTITLDQDVVIRSLNSAATLSVDGVSATVEQASTVSGVIFLNGATAQLTLSGTVDVSGEILAGAGTLNLINAVVTADGAGAGVTANAAATLDAVDLHATNGGMLSLLGAASFISASGGNSIDASGVGSRVDLSGLSSFAGGGGGSTQITALSGGEVAVSGDVDGYTVWTLDGSGGALDVSGVTSLVDATVNVSEGAVLAFTAATTLQNVNLTAAEGGEILFPVATSYMGHDSADNTLQATGAGSRIDLSNLATFEGGGEHQSGSYPYPWHYYTTYVQALAGGEVDLAGAFSHRNEITVDGAGSVLGVAGITQLNGTVLTVNTPGTLTFSAVTEVKDSSLTAPADVVLAFTAATTLQNVNLTAAEGGEILFPVATSYMGHDSADNTLQATGAGSRIDLSNLATFEGGGEHQSGSYPYPWHYYTTYVQALAGGEVDLAGAFSHRNEITVDGAGSVLGVAGITQLNGTVLTVNTPGTLTFSAVTEVKDSSLTAPADVVLAFTAATTLQNINLTAAEGGEILFPVATSYMGHDSADNTLQATGAGSRIDLSNLATFEGGGEHQSGSYPYPWHYYTTYVQALAGGEVDLAGAFSHRNEITVDGAGSVLGVAGITQLNGTVLTVNTPGTLTFSAVTEVKDSSLTAPADVVLAFTAATTLQNVNLTAAEGGEILFPVATSYMGHDSADNTLQATGAGSRIDLSNLATFEGGGEHQSGSYPYPWHYYTTYVQALAGGEVDLAGAFSHRNEITVDGAGSVLGVAGITQLNGTVLTVNTPGTLTFSAVTEVKDSSLTAPADVVLAFTAATTLQNVNLTAAEGGEILFPVATSYMGHDSADNTLQATGAGSRIDLSNLATFEGGGEHQSGSYPYPWHYYTTYVQALAGGEVDLAGAFSHRNEITVDGAGSVLGVAGITQLNGTVLTVNTPGTLTFSAVTEVKDSSLTAPADVVLAFTAATTLQNVNLTAAEGGEILFPVATSYMGHDSADNTLQATGAGSRIDLSNLATFEGGGEHQSGSYPYPWHYYTTYVQALAGGEVDLAGAFSHRNEITVDGAGSVLGVAGITQLNGTVLTVNTPGTLTFSAVTEVKDSSLTAPADVVLAFTAATTLQNVNLTAAEGGEILFPVATSYMGHDSADNTLQATGAGSRIDLSNLATFEGGGEHQSGSYPYPWHYYTTYVQALAGGEVDLAGAFSHRNEITVDGAGSVLGVAGITQLNGTVLTVNTPGTLTFSAVTEVKDSSLTAPADVVLAFTAATTLQNVNLTAAEGGEILFPVATSYMGHDSADNTLQATGAGSRIDLSNLATFEGGGEYQDGGYPYTWHYYTTYVQALAGGEVDLAGAISHRNEITVDGVGSVLGVAGITSLSGTVLTAANGFVWIFPAGWHPTWGGGNTLSTVGAGSQFINRSTLSISGAALSINTSDFVNDGVLHPETGGVFDVNESFRVDDLGILAGLPGGSFTISGDLLGDTRNADQYAPQAIVSFDGSGTSTDPQRLEVMSRDVGADPAGFSRNFVYTTLDLSNDTYLQLVDLSDNATGTDAEAVYVKSLIVPTGTTLDLGGLHLYTRAAQIGGTIVGGLITQIPDSGPVTIASPTPGAISVPGELDEWSFFARAGQSIRVAVDTGSGAVLSPVLNWAHVELVDANDTVLASSENSTAGETIALDEVAIAADGLLRVRIKAPASQISASGNYVVSAWDVTADVSSLLLNKQVMGQIENPYSVDKWQFSASAGTQVRFDLINQSQPGIVFDMSGPAGWIGFNDLTNDSELISLPTAGAYTLTARGIGGQAVGAYSFKLQQTRVTDLALGSFQTGQFVGSGQAELFRIETLTSNPLKIVLDDDSSNNANELYLKFGAPPTRSDYDYRFSAAAAADQEIVVPMAYTGQWYALVYGDTIRTNSAFDISARSNGVFLTGVTPVRYAADATATLTLSGGGFDATTTVHLLAPDMTVVPATAVVVNSASRLTATVSLDGLSPGMYSLIASEPGGDSDVLMHGFTVTGAGAGQLDIQLIVPSVLGRQATATLYVDYANTGNEAIAAPLLILYSDDPDDSDRPLMTLNQARVNAGFWTSAAPAGFSTSVQFLTSGSTPGLLQPGEFGRTPVYFIGLEQPWDFGDRTVEFRVGVATDDGSTVDWDAIRDSLRPDYVEPDAWQAIWDNFVANVGGNWTGYLTALNENASYLGALGASTSEISRLFGFELRQAEGLSPIRYLAATTQASMPAPGPDLVFSQAFAQPISRRYELGPLGRGWTNNWQLSLATEPDGTVRITDMTGTPRIFQSDRRPYVAPAVAAALLVLPPGPIANPIPSNTHYTAAAGDQGILTPYADGSYMLTEIDGTQYYFRADGKLDFVRDTNNNRITCTYTGALLTGLTHSFGQSLTIGYNGAGRITSVTDSDGRQTLYTYDASNQHLLSARDYDGRTTSYSYISGQGAAKEHALSEIVFADGSHRYYTYDSQGRLASTSRDGGAETISFSYDSAGTVTITDALGNGSQFFFDDWGTILKSTNPLGNSTLLSLDANRNLSSVTDPAGVISLFQYDARDNLTRFTDAMGHATSFSYTTDFNQLDKLTDANGNLTDYNYDSRGNLTNITYADGSREGWAYDSLGRPTTWTNRRGTPVGVTYDGDGQITRKSYADGSHADYLYDARGNLTSAATATGTTTLTYDANDYLTRIDYPGPGGRSLAYTYDSGGRRVTSTDQLGHQLRYGFDTVGRLSRITDENSMQVVLYEYDAAGRMARKTLGNGVYTTYDYDAAGQLLHLVNHMADSTVLSRFDYSYDSRGRRISMGTLDGTWTYGYDDIAQLTHAVFISTNPALADQDLLYVYDEMGNRIQTVENGVATVYTTNNLNQYTQVGDTTYTFDADGNLVSEISPSGTVLYSYDDENWLIAVQSGAGSSIYSYDAFGLRAFKSVNGTPTYYSVDLLGFARPIGGYDAAGGLIERYDFGFGLLSRQDNSTTAWYTFDAIGNAVNLTDSTESEVAGYSYAPYGGMLRQVSTVANPFQFVGELGVMWEGNSLNFMQARYYDPGIGRFSQADPIGIRGGINQYSYTSNSPTMRVDPSGLQCAGLLTQLGADQAIDLGFGGALGLGIGVAGGIIAGAGSPVIGGVLIVGGIFLLGYSVVSGAMDYTSTISDILDSGTRNLQRNLGGGILSGSSHGSSRGAGRPGQATQQHQPDNGGGLAMSAGSGTVQNSTLVDDQSGQRSPTPRIGVSRGCVDGISGEPDSKLRVFGIGPSEVGEPGGPCVPTPPTTGGPGGGGRIPGAIDPNQKLGPSGFGPAGYITPSTTLPYRIDFENDATATAPAQNVTITDQLDTDLNWSTFALTEIGFGDHRIAIPGNPQYFENTVPFHYNNQDFEVQIAVGLNLASGQLVAHFYSIDPNTSLPPDVLTGFLPPEDGTGRGMGYITYRIDQKPGLATGTEIKNIALISFDGQPWIATNQIDPHDPAAGIDPAKEALNTIDAGAPSSAVISLQSTRTAPDFLVTWSGTDDAGGSGIASHDIYVSTDGDSYALWLDDITADSAIFSGQAGHSYAFYSVAQDNVGHVEGAPATPDASTQVVDGLAVTRAAIDTSGVSVRFNRPLDPTTLNLYATETGGQGPADVTLLGATTGAVTGSLILDADLTGFRFIKTGGVLPADTYTLTLRSAADGFLDTVNHLLDGDDDGTPGGDYLSSFAVVGPLPRVLSLPDVVRGPGQPVNIPATVAGIPIRLSDGSDVESLEFTLNYDPALLTISDVTAAASLPDGSQLVANLSVPGQLRVAMSFPTPLPAGALDLLTLTAAVPASASTSYRVKQVLDLTDLSLNEGALAAVGDDAVHVVAYFGDTTGNGSYSSLDGQRVLRHTVGLDSGFAAYPLADPVLIGDITGNGAVSSLDATRILQEVVGIDRIEIPPLAGIVITAPGPDPYVNIPTDLSGTPGSLITVPVLIDEANGLESVDLRLVYDPALLEVVALRAGSVTTGATMVTNPAMVSNANGTLVVGLALTNPRLAGGGSLLEIDLRIKPTAASGTTALNLTQVSLNEDGLVLTPLPVPGQDGSDGLLTIRSVNGNTPPLATDDNYTTDEDTLLAIPAAGILANDSDLDDDGLRAILVDGPAHGTLSLNDDGSFRYTPDADYFGPDGFTYRAFDGTDESGIASVSLTINPVNDSPDAVDDGVYTVHHGQTLTVPAATGALANDSDPDGDTLTAALDSLPQFGSISFLEDGSFDYTPYPGYVGTDSFSYTINDGAFSDSATVTIEITNAAPDAVDDGVYTVHHGQTLTVPAATGALANDSDPDRDTLTAALDSVPQYGSVSFQGDGSFDYTPYPGYVGTDSFSYTINDGAFSDSATVTIEITNAAPDAVDDGVYTVHHDQTLTVLAASGALANDSDPDGDTLTAALDRAPQYGSLSFQDDGSFDYTPYPGYVGSDSFSYTISDGAFSDTATVTIEITNAAPDAVDDGVYSVHHGQTLTVPAASGALANDSDPDGDTLTAALDRAPQYGSLSFQDDGSFDYTPYPGYVGTDSFSYTINDGASSDTATVSIEVTNAAPDAVDDGVYSLHHGQTLNVPAASGALANDSDPDGDTLTAALNSFPQYGSLSFQDDGSFDYTPHPGYVGSDSFSYTIHDGAFSDTATITLDVTDGAPVAVDDSYSIHHGQTLTVPAATGALANDSDPDGDSLAASLTSAPQNGTLSLDGDGAFVYTPFAGYVGSDSFSYMISDGALSDTATITVQVTDSAPDAVDDSYTVFSDQTLTVPAATGALANDSDSDGDSLTASLTSAPQNGTLSLNSDGAFVYTPYAGYVGSDSFSYTLSDGALSDTATINIEVGDAEPGPAYVNIPTDLSGAPGSVLTVPVLIDDAIGLESVDLSLAYESALLEVVAVRAGSATSGATIITNPTPVSNANGTLVVGLALTNPRPAGGGSLIEVDFRIKPNATSGTTVLNLTQVSLNEDALVLMPLPVPGQDGSDGLLTVLPGSNTPPVATDDAYTLDEDTPLNIPTSGVLDNDADIDSPTLTALLAEGPQHGTLALAPDGGFLYTPNGDYSGSDSFSYRANDGQLDSNLALVTLTIQPVNDAPVATDDAYTLDEDTPLSIAVSGVLGNDSDIDSPTLTAVLVEGPQHGTLALAPDGGFLYTPDADYFGSDSFTYRANDGQLDSNLAVVTLTIQPVNDDPIAVDDRASTPEDTPIVLSLAANDTDVDNDPLSVSAVGTPQHGSAVLNLDGTVTYTPFANYSGDDAFDYTVSDGAGGQSVGTVRIVVSSVNTAPVAADDAYTLDEDTPLSVSAAGVLENDADIDSPMLTAVLVEGPQHGTLTLAPDGGFFYIPDADYFGSDSFTYRANDGQLDSNLALVTLTIQPVNDAPVATDDTYTLDEDTPLSIAVSGVLGNDSDIDSPTLTAVLVEGPQHGTLALAPDGGFLYTPDADYFGSDSFTYRANDGQLDSNLAVVTLTIQPVNDDPIAVDDRASTPEDTPIVLSLAANDTDVDNDPLSVSVVGTPQHGSAVLNLDGTVTYTPFANYSGDDAFDYTVSDGAGGQSVGTVRIVVSSVNTAPVAADDAYTLDEDTPLSVSAAGVLDNDADIDSPMLTAVLVEGPQHGTLTLAPDGGFLYTPNADYFGSDSFTYRASDGHLDSNLALVTLTIQPVNDAPVATDDAYTLDEDTPLNVPMAGVLGNDTDIDSPALTVALVDGPQHGTLTLAPDGGFLYTPNADYFGNDSFTYRASDGQLDSNLALVTLTIQPVNDAPVATDDAYTLDEDTPLSISAAGVLGNDTDIDSPTLTAALVDAPQHGTLSLAADGSFLYTPNADYFGRDSFTYRANNGQLDSNLALVTLTIQPVNDVPVATDDAYTLEEDTPLSIAVSGVLGNDSDIDSPTLTAVLAEGPQHGTLAVAGDGGFLYTPNADYFGSDSFTYRANDGQLDSNLALVTLTIQPVNDAPSIDPIANQTVDEGSPLSFIVSASDVENDALSFGLDSAPLGAAIDAASGLFSWTPGDGPVSAPIVVRATDAAGAFSTTAFDVSVLNVAPTLLLSGAASIGLGQPYTLDLSASDPGQDSISGWQIHWGDGSSEDITGNPASVTHTYLSSGVMSFTATATDEDGSYAANSLQVQVAAPEALQVSALTPTASGFQVRFNRAIDPSALNLYDSEAAQLGAPDLTLVGFAGGPVKGSLIVDADQRGLSFLRSGDILAPDTYTIRLESGANAFKDLAGGSLDGNGDGTAGDAFQSSFTVAATGPTLSLPDLMRGPGQSVDLTAPSQNGFLPLYLSDGAGVTDVEFTLHYDPTSLVVQGVSAGADLPATATIERLPTADGLLKVRISSPTALAAGKVELLHIAAMVPTTAAYGAKHLLDLDEVRVNGQTATADDALQLVAYLGDTSGDASYSTLDGQRIQRVLVKLDSGFAAYANVDPLIVADTNANGYLSSIDASRVFQEVSYLTGASTLDRLELPPIPAGIGPLSLAGPDPLVDIPIDARGEAGELITVPVRIDTAAGLESVQLQIGYDASRFDLVEVRRGSLSGDFGWFITGQEAGRIRVDMTRLNALQGGSGTLLDIDLRIKPDALPGVTAVDLQYARLNDGRLTLGVLPQVGADASDGRITILGKTLEPVPPSSTALRDAHLPSTLLQRQRQWQPTQQARFDGASQASSTAGDSVPSLPVIDFGSSFSLPAVASDGLAADGKSKAWLQDYLGNAGQARKASPNAGLKVSLPVAASGAGVASRGVLRP